MVDLNSMSGKEFETLIKQLVGAMGFGIERCSVGPDGGIDILASTYKDLVSGRYVIQCKRYSHKVGVKPVRELFGVVTAEGANKGVLITNSTFTKPARDFAEGKPIELVDGSQLMKLLDKYIPDHPAIIGYENDEKVVAAFLDSLVRDLETLRNDILQRQRDLELGVVQLQLIFLDSRPKLEKLLTQNLSQQVLDARSLWNQLIALRDILARPSIDKDSMNKCKKLVAASHTTIHSLLRLQTEALSFRNTAVNFDPGHHPLRDLRVLYDILFSDVINTLETLVDVIARGDIPAKGLVLVDWSYGGSLANYINTKRQGTDNQGNRLELEYQLRGTLPSFRDPNKPVESPDQEDMAEVLNQTTQKIENENADGEQSVQNLTVGPKEPSQLVKEFNAVMTWGMGITSLGITIGLAVAFIDTPSLIRVFTSITAAVLILGGALLYFGGVIIEKRAKHKTEEDVEVC